MSTNSKKEIYDDIVLDYAAAVKTNVFRVKHVETKFWKEIGDVKDQTILDLACGSGDFTRQMKENGANAVVGVDISEEMVIIIDYNQRRPIKCFLCLKMNFIF